LYRLPKNRTIILHFTDQLISSEANDVENKEGNQLLKKYAEEITLITGIPCFYHLCKKWEQHAGRWVFIIGHTKVKDGEGYIDFFRICKEKIYELRTKCSEIDPRYEKYRTMMELDDGTEDVLKVENRFSTLPVEDMSDESDEDLGSHIYDDDTDVETTEGLDQAC